GRTSPLQQGVAQRGTVDCCGKSFTDTRINDSARLARRRIGWEDNDYEVRGPRQRQVLSCLLKRAKLVQREFGSSINTELPLYQLLRQGSALLKLERAGITAPAPVVVIGIQQDAFTLLPLSHFVRACPDQRTIGGAFADRKLSERQHLRHVP